MWFCKICFTTNEDRDCECHVCSSPRPREEKVFVQERDAVKPPQPQETSAVETPSASAQQDDAVAVASPEADTILPQPAEEPAVTVDDVEQQATPSQEQQNREENPWFFWKPAEEAPPEPESEPYEEILPDEPADEEEQTEVFNPGQLSHVVQAPAKTDKPENKKELDSLFDDLLRVISDDQQDSMETIRQKKEKQRQQQKENAEKVKEEEREKRKAEKEVKKRVRERKKAAEKEKRQQEFRKAVLQFCKVARILFFLAAACTFISLVAVIVLQLISGDIASVAENADALWYSYEKQFVEVIEYNLPQIIEHFEYVIK